MVPERSYEFRGAGRRHGICHSTQRVGGLSKHGRSVSWGAEPKTHNRGIAFLAVPLLLD